MIIKTLRKLKSKYITHREISYVKKFFKNSHLTSPSNKNFNKKGNILIFSIIGSAHNIWMEILIYKILKKEGYNIDFVIDKKKALIL